MSAAETRPLAKAYTRELREAVENLYRVFSSVPRPTEIDGSLVHDIEAIWSGLTTAPLRQLTAKQLYSLAMSGGATLGDARHYRHFLPRILELTPEGGTGWTADEIAVRLDWNKWTEWPASEREAILAFFRAGFRWAIAGHPDIVEAGVWLLALGDLHDPVSPRLAEWRSNRSGNAALQLALLVSDYNPKTFRALDPGERTALEAWRLGPETNEQLMAAIGAVSEADRWQLEAAFDRIG